MMSSTPRSYPPTLSFQWDGPWVGYDSEVRAGVIILALTGCDALFSVTTVENPDARGDATPTCFTESFSGSDEDLLVSWDRGADNAGCNAKVDTGSLLIDIAPNTDCYAF